MWADMEVCGHGSMRGHQDVGGHGNVRGHGHGCLMAGHVHACPARDECTREHVGRTNPCTKGIHAEREGEAGARHGQPYECYERKACWPSGAAHGCQRLK